jgi:sulfur-oxidizing protein SoxY
MPAMPRQRMTRRQTLCLGAQTAAMALLAGPRALIAATNEAAAEIAQFTGGKTTAAGAIAIDVPEIVENGNSVPLSVAIDSPMTPDDRITEAIVIAEMNPQPRIATFHFSAMSGRAEAGTRIRLASTGNVFVLARTSNGKLYADSKQVKVTIGGCGG